MKRAATLLLCLGLSACGGSGLEDLERFVQESGQGLRGKVDPLPEMKPYEPFMYAAFDLPDPFKPRRIEKSDPSAKIPPEVARLQREPLEAFPLESLKMVGSLAQKGATFALIKAPDASVYRVKAGNFLGQDYGKIVEISESGLKLVEQIEDSAAREWTTRENTLLLVEEQEQRK